MVPLPQRAEGGFYAVQHVGELDRILERELGSRADREMCGVRRVAQQDDIAARPALALDALEVEPGRRTDEVRGVRLQAMPVEILGEQFFAGGDALVLAHPAEAEAVPRRFRTFD